MLLRLHQKIAPEWVSNLVGLFEILSFARGSVCFSNSGVYFINDDWIGVQVIIFNSKFTLLISPPSSLGKPFRFSGSPNS
jgi:hypothetical protein